MNKAMLEYIKSIKPEAHRDGREILKEGIEEGKTIEAGKSRFARESSYSSYLEYKKAQMKEGKICWNILMGLATLEEQVEATKELYDFTQRTGLTVDSLQPIPSGLVALPKEYRDQAPSTTSFVTETFEDYKAQVEAAPIEVTFNDYHPLDVSAAEWLLPLAAEHDVGVLNGAAMAHGLLTGQDPDMMAVELNLGPHLRALLPAARRFYHWCKEKNVSVPAVVFQFCMRQPLIHCTLTGVKNRAELEENLRGAMMDLPGGIWEELDALGLSSGV